MEIIENFGEYQNYWETNRFWNEELINYSWATNDQQFNLGYYDSSSQDGTASTVASKNIVSERNRRKKLTDKLIALREAVPKITKLDKASTIKDAIEYIQDLQEQERKLQAEVMELESERLKNNPAGFDFEEELPLLIRSKKTKYDQTNYDHSYLARSYPIEVHELSITSMGEKTMYVSLTCKKTADAMIRISQVFESLKLKIITANVTTLSGMVKKTVLIEAAAGEEEKEHLKIKIERAVSALKSTCVLSM